MRVCMQVCDIKFHVHVRVIAYVCTRDYHKIHHIHSLTHTKKEEPINFVWNLVL